MDLRPPLDVVASKLAAACARCGAAYALIGGVAAGAHGSGLPTRDVDACIALSPSDAAGVEAFLRAMESEGFRVNVDALKRRAARGRTILFLWLGLVRADIMLLKAGTLWEQVLRHRRRMEVGSSELWIAAPEEIIVTKLAAGREKDMEAVRKIAAIHLRALDLERMRAGAARLVASAPELPARLDELIAEARELDRLASEAAPDEPTAG